jgi:DNA polymerase III subunit epsilon
MSSIALDTETIGLSSRQIALDTETTGLSTEHGHRIIEIGCVELIDRKITGSNFHFYLDPGRDVDPGAFAVHGLSNEFLKNKPKFTDVFEQFLDYIKGSELIIHNAPFDIGFINYEFSLLGHLQPVSSYCLVFDTLTLARQRHPGQKNNLDALCKRYEVDNSHRNLHGALLDADLLARIYLAMTGGQGSLFGDSHVDRPNQQIEAVQFLSRNKALPVMTLNDNEERAHVEFIELLFKSGEPPIWDE